MGYLNQFPNTNFYDQDLGWLIKAYKDLSTKEDGLEERVEVLESIYTKVVDESKIIAKDTTLEQLEEWLKDGTLQKMLDNEYVVCIGDSYLKGNSGDSIIKSWGGYLCNMMGLVENTNFFQFAEGGSGFYTNRGTSGKRFIDILKDSESSFDKTKVTKLIIGGGFNDATAPYSDLIAYIRQFITYVNSEYPNATLYIAFMGWDCRYGTTARDNRTNLSLNTLYAYNSATRFGTKVKTIVCNNVLKQAYYMSSDGYHPNTNGYTGLAMTLYNMLTGTYKYHSLSQTDNLKYGIKSKVYQGTSHSIIKDNEIIYKLDNVRVTFDSPVSISSTELANFVTNTQNSDNTGSVFIWLLIEYNDGTSEYVQGRLTSDDNNTSLLLQKNLSNVKSLSVTPQYVTANISQTLLLEIKE